MAKHLWLRGTTYWFRMRRPKRFQDVYPADFITQSLKTDSLDEARSLAPMVRRQWLATLDARLAGGLQGADRETYDQGLSLAKAHGRGFTSTESLATGPIADLVEAIEHVKALDPDASSALFPAFLGGIEVPDTTVSELLCEMERLAHAELVMKNPRQTSGFLNRWKRAAGHFYAAVGDKPIKEISKADAFALRRHWQNRVLEDHVQTGYANKHLGYLKEMVAAFYADLEIDVFENPFQNVRIEKKPIWEQKRQPKRTPEFSPNWILETIIKPGKLDGLNAEARDILKIVAETGCRAAEIYDTPASSFHLDGIIPYILIQVEMPDPKSDATDVRDIKTASSVRRVPLVGVALEAALRHPAGFPRYRGKANFSNAAMKYLRQNELLPSPDHKVKSLRHSYEGRMKRAGLDNEERGQLMGHSLKRIRGRELYGDETELRIRALFAEMVAFPTESWTPRSYEVLSEEIDKILREEGYKLPR